MYVKPLKPDFEICYRFVMNLYKTFTAQHRDLVNDLLSTIDLSERTVLTMSVTEMLESEMS